jgi:hypothetical protein
MRRDQALGKHFPLRVEREEGEMTVPVVLGNVLG